MKATTGPLYERLIYLRRRYRQENRLASGLLDSGPFINVALLLFMFFVLNTPFVLQPGVRLDLPVAPFTDGMPYGALVVTVTHGGQLFFNDNRATMPGLSLAFSQAVHDSPDAVLLIAADDQVSQATLMEVYTRAMAAGFKKAYLATQPPPAGGAPP